MCLWINITQLIVPLFFILEPLNWYFLLFIIIQSYFYPATWCFSIKNSTCKLLVQFYPNFTGMISTKSSCALSVCLSLSQNLSPLLLINYWGNFILTLQEFMSPLLRSLLRLSQNLSQHEIGHHEATHVITDRSCSLLVKIYIKYVYSSIL
jgi:hypothetical protein